MSTLILSSDGIDSLEIEAEFRKHINNNTRVAIIPTAKVGEKKIIRSREQEELFRELFCPKAIDFIDLETDAPEKLLDYDFVYLLGGSPFRLQFYINKSNAKEIFKKMIKRNITIAGVSAGSMVLGKNMGVCEYLSPEMNEEGLKDFRGLGLTDVNICPHYNNFPEKYEDCDKKIRRFSRENSVKVTKINDGEALVVDTETGKIKKLKGEVIVREKE